MILSKWEIYGASEKTLTELSYEMMNHTDVIEEIAAVYAENSITQNVLDDLVLEIPKLAEEARGVMTEMLVAKKDHFTPKQWKQVKTIL